MSDIQKLEHTLKALGDKLNAGLSSYDERITTLAAPDCFTCQDVAALAADFLRLKAFTKKTFLLLRKQVEAFAAGLDSLEKKSRSKVLLFHGVCKTDNHDVVSMVISLVKNKLCIPNISASNRAVCHRLGQPKADSEHPRPVLVWFEKLSDRTSVWMSKTKLKGCDVSFSEIFTRTRHQILVEAWNQFDIKRVWSQDGTVIIAHSGKSHKVNITTQLTDLLKSVPAHDSQSTSEQPKASKATRRSRWESNKKKRRSGLPDNVI